MSFEIAPRPTFVLVARLPVDGVASFQGYENAVLPLLGECDGRLERRLRNPDGTIEAHLVSFDSEQSFQRFRADPRRAAFAHLMERSSAAIEIVAVADVGQLR
jgi:hypothetical protein